MSLSHVRGTQNAVDAETVELGPLLAELAREVEHAASVCSVLQWSISTLLERVNHPDLAAEIHMLQDIDRLQQTLADISAILSVSASKDLDAAVSLVDLRTSIRLESLRTRLKLSGTLGGEDTPNLTPDPDDITWF